MTTLSSSLATFAETVRLSAGEAVLAFMTYVPNAFFALVLFGAGVGVGALLSRLTSYVAMNLGFDTLSQRTGFAKVLHVFGDNVLLSGAFAFLVQIAAIAAFSMAALKLLSFGAGLAFLMSVVSFIPKVFIALLALLVGFSGAELAVYLARRAIALSKVPVAYGVQVAVAAVRVTVVAIGFVASLRVLGATDAMVTAAFVAFVAAVGLAFGLGGKDKASSFLATSTKDGRA